MNGWLLCRRFKGQSDVYVCSDKLYCQAPSAMFTTVCGSDAMSGTCANIQLTCAFFRRRLPTVIEEVLKFDRVIDVSPTTRSISQYCCRQCTVHVLQQSHLWRSLLSRMFSIQQMLQKKTSRQYNDDVFVVRRSETDSLASQRLLWICLWILLRYWNS